MKPPKWTEEYPHGTKEGDEELKFFIILSRNPKFQWRSVGAIAKESGLTKERVEEIINKYYKKGMVFQHPKNDDNWGYWERVPEMLPKPIKSISQKDHDDRINRITDCKDDCCGGSCSSDSAAVCDYYVKADGGKVFYIDIKPSKASKADDFIKKMKEAFHKKKIEKLQEKLGESLEERWHAPTDDECGWFPIRPKTEPAITEEDFLAKESERAWCLDI